MASAAVMALEIVGGRILAPWLGTSLYTWTATLGAAFAGIALGSWVGGRLRGDLPWVLLGGAGLCWLVPVFANAVSDWQSLRSVPVAPRVFVANVALLLLPCTLLSAALPLAARGAVTSSSTAGASVGSLYAASTLGGLVGTFAAGFWAIDAIGTRWTLVGAGALVWLVGAWIARDWRAFAPLALLAVLVIDGRALRGPCLDETPYYCIQIEELDVDAAAGPALTLWLDNLSHSRVWLLDPARLSFSYIRAYAEATVLVAQRKPSFRALAIGGGGYALPRYLEATYPSATITVLELDPAVTEVSFARLGLSRSTRIETLNGDARTTLVQSGLRDLDVVYGDAFNDLSMPYHLTTVEFLREVSARMAPDGIYLSNVIDQNATYGAVTRSFLRTVGEVFPHVALVRWGPPEPVRLETLVVLGAKAPFDREALSRRDQISVIDASALVGPSTVLLDDYAPVEQLTAPLSTLR